MIKSRITEGEKLNFCLKSVWFSWALDPQFINFRFSLAAVHEL